MRIRFVFTIIIIFQLKHLNSSDDTLHPCRPSSFFWTLFLLFFTFFYILLFWYPFCLLFVWRVYYPQVPLFNSYFLPCGKHNVLANTVKRLFLIYKSQVCGFIPFGVFSNEHTKGQDCSFRPFLFLKTVFTILKIIFHFPLYT